MILPRKERVCGQECHRSDVVFSAYFIRKCMLMVHSSIGDVNFDSLIKLVSPRCHDLILFSKL